VSESLEGLVQRISEAVATRPCTPTTCAAVEEALTEAIEEADRTGVPLLPARYRIPDPDRYARYRVARDPEGRFSMIAMVWGPGQGTPIHDHGGLWCVECVVQGRIRVRAFQPEDHPAPKRLDFEEEERLMAGRGEAGHLIPPLDHHVIDNPHEDPAVTLHVYGGDMAWCHAFEPHPDGGYVKVRRVLQTENGQAGAQRGDPPPRTGAGPDRWRPGGDG
jgi:3-mercaptopropionate dioxygenase